MAKKKKSFYWRFILIVSFLIVSVVAFIYLERFDKTTEKSKTVVRQISSTEKTDSLIVEQLIQRSVIFYEENKTNPEIFDSFLQEALNFAIQHNIIYCQSVIYSIIGQREKNRLHHAEALKSFQNALELALLTENEKLLTDIYNQKGVVYRYLNNNTQSIEFHLKALQLAEKNRDSLNISIAFNSIGVLNYNLGRYHSANEYFSKSLNYSEQMNDINGNAINNLGIGSCRLKLNEPDSALYFFNKAMEYNIKNNNPAGQATCFDCISAVYIKQGDTKKALLYIEKALEINSKLGNQLDISSNLMKRGEIYFTLKNFDLAFANFSEALQIAIEINSKQNAEEAYRLMSMTFESKGFYSDALKYYKNASYYRDSIFNDQNMTHLITMETILDTEFHKQKIIDLNNEKNLQEMKLVRQRLTLIILIVSTTIIVLITVLLIHQSKLRARYFGLRFQQRLLRTQMDPHFIFNALSAIQTYILENDIETSSRFLSDFSKLMRQILRSSESEYISIKEEAELIGYYLNLQQLRFEPTFNFNIEIDKNITPEEIIVPPMILQPFVENAIEHGIKDIGSDGVIIVSFKKNEKQIILEIDDNGLGINALREKPNISKGHESKAISITKKRLEVLRHDTKGKTGLEIIDKKYKNPFDRGTKVRIILPLVKKNKTKDK